MQKARLTAGLSVGVGSLFAPLPDIHEKSRDRRGGRHRRRDEMRAAAITLPAFEVAVRGRGAALARLELVGIHGEAHRAARLAPVEARGLEDLVETFLLRLL